MRGADVSFQYMTVVGVQRHRAEVHGQQDDVLVEDEEIEDCAAPLASQGDPALHKPHARQPWCRLSSCVDSTCAS